MSDFQYSVIFKNNSSQAGSACLYQTDPASSASSLVWLSRYAFPTTSVNFQWKQNYGLCWSQTGVLQAGVVVTATQYWDSDLKTDNEVTFNYEPQHRAFTFEDQRQGQQAGSLFIQDTGTIPADVASVGIGMAGSPILMTQATANMTYEFKTKPEYWIAFGNTTQGEVINVSTMNNPSQIQFPANIYSMTAILNEDLTWTIEPTSITNARLVEAKAAGKMVNFGDLG